MPAYVDLILLLKQEQREREYYKIFPCKHAQHEGMWKSMTASREGKNKEGYKDI